MKYLLLSIALFIQLGNCLAQKQVTVGNTILLIKGEKVIGYEEQGLYTTETAWVEVYLNLTKDSIIVTEIQSKSMNSIVAQYVYISGVKISNIDYDNIMAVKHDMIKRPSNLLKVVLTTKGEAEAVTTHAWGTEGSLGTIPASSLRIIVQNDEQAMDIIRRIKNK